MMKSFYQLTNMLENVTLSKITRSVPDSTTNTPEWTKNKRSGSPATQRFGSPNNQPSGNYANRTSSRAYQPLKGRQACVLLRTIRSRFKQDYPTWNLHQDFENLVLAEAHHFQPQNSDTSWFDEVLGQAKLLLSTLGVDGTDVLEKMEHCAVFAWQVTHADSMVDYTCALSALLSSLFGTSLTRLTTRTFTTELMNLFKSEAGTAGTEASTAFEPQSAEDFFVALRERFDFLTNIGDLPIMGKLYKLFLHILSRSLLEPLGVSFDTIGYTKFEEQAIRRAHGSNLGFWHSLFDAVSLFCVMMTKAVKQGSWAPFLHNTTTYQEWVDTVFDLKGKQDFLGNAEAVGFDFFEYQGQLDHAIEHGAAILRHIPTNQAREYGLVRGLCKDLGYIRDELLTKKAAQASRPAPFGILVVGGSSIGKSNFCEILFTYYGQLFGHPVASEYKYTRNFNDDYWSGFATSKWCLILDDVAALSTRFTTPDPTIKEVIQVLNNTAFVPNQASLEDKGRTPVMAKLVVATSNTSDMNASHNYGCPLAIQRRLPFVIKLRPKLQFARIDSPEMLDPTKLNKASSGTYDNYWNIEVCQVVQHGEGNSSQRAAHKIIGVYDDVHDFLVWYANAAKDHVEQQASLMRAHEDMAAIKVCGSCYRPETLCSCTRIRPDGWREPSGIDVAIPEVPEDDDFPYVSPHTHDDEPDQTEDPLLYATHPGDAAEFLPQSLTEVAGGALTLSWYVLQLYKFLGMWCAMVIFASAHVLGPVYVCRTMIVEFLAHHFKCFVHAKIELAKQNAHRELRMLALAMEQRLSPLKQHAKVFGAVAGVLAIVVGAQKLLKHSATTRETTSAAVVPQSDLTEVGGRPKPLSEERTNVWYNTIASVTAFDVAMGSASWKGLPLEQVVAKLGRSVVRLRLRCCDGKIKTTGALALGGWLYAVNTHAIPEEYDTFSVEMIQTDSKEGVNPNVNFLLARTSIFTLPGRDLSIIMCKALGPKSGVRHLLVRPTFEGKYLGSYYTRTSLGFIQANELTEIIPMTHEWNPQEPTKVWQAKSEILTVNGDCGSPMLARAPTGPVILGIHAAGNQHSQVIATPIYEEDVVAAEGYFGGFTMQGGEPMLNAPTAPERALVSLDNKSTTRWFREGTANVYGSLTGPRARPKSCVVHTSMAQAAMRHGYVERYGPPALSGWEPWRIAYQDMLHIPATFRSDIIKAATRAFTADILALIHPEDLAEVMVYDTFTAINGATGVTYVDKLQRNTSMGFPWNRSKKYYLTAVPPAHGVLDPVEISQEVLDRTQIILDKYEQGERAMPVFKAHLKDEPTSFKKIAAKKTRLFGGAPVDWALVVRMYLLSFIRLAQNNRFIFESAPGTIAQSSEWGEIRSYLTHFGTDRIVAGDYKAFDKTMPPEFILAAFEIIIEVCRAAGYTEQQLQVVWGIGVDTAYPLYDLNGDLVEFFGSEPSGHNLTVIINGLVNCLYMRYTYIVLNPEHEAESFKDNVHLMTYGDDNVLGVSRTASWFNHTEIQRVLADHGVTYTMADKEAESVPYIPIRDVSFLKRSWRYDADLQDFTCPLEHESIEKMLITCVASKSVSREYQGISAISSAVQEYFFYGKEEFHKRSALLATIVVESELQAFVEPSTFPTWFTLAERFKSYGAPKRWNEQLDKGRQRVARQPREPKSPKKPEQLPAALEEAATDDDLDVVFIPQSDVNKNNQEDLARCGMRQRRVEPRNGPTLAGGTCDSRAQARTVRPFLPPVSNPHLYEKQSDESTPMETSSATNETTQETVSFMDEGTTYATGTAAAHPSSATADALSGAELGDFLGRPAQIASFTWSQSDVVGTTRSYNVWQNFFNNAAIRRKLENFAWLRCDLKVKIMVNASPFYYGAMLATYQPLPNFSPSTIVNDTGTRYFIPLTQRPHAWIYPQNNEGAEMTLPFFWPKNWLSTLSNADFADMGTLSLVSFTDLLSANGATGSGATFTIYAWAENVTLNGPTCGLIMQAKDEYGKGPVSSVASAIAAAAKSLAGIPLIRPYATATQMGATAVAQAATALGFCNTPVIEDTRPVRAGAVPVFSSSEQGYPLDKLTLDPKNELTVDPSVVGCGPHDELTISHLVQKESFLCRTTWTGTQTVDTLLFQSGVTPVMFDMDDLTQAKLYLTPPAWVAQMFQYWRGDVIFRFRFIATQYHRGRVRIVYDPSGNSAQNVSNQTSTQVPCFNEVIDLTKDTNVEVRVPYSQALAWSRVIVPTSSTQLPWTTSTTSTFEHVPGFTNGSIVMRVVTAVTGPTSTVSIPILVSVRGAPNLEFAGPAAIQARYSLFAPQSGDEYEVTPSIAVTTGGPSQTDDQRFLVNHGECIFSLRQLLRRYSWSTFVGGRTNSDVRLTKYEFHRLPRAYGYDPAGVHKAKGLVTTATNFSFNNAANHPLTWVSTAFIGTRGSVNWTVLPVTTNTLPSACSQLTVGRLTGVASYGVNIAAFPAAFDTQLESALSMYLLGNRKFCNSGGVALTAPQTNVAVNVSCPMYSAYKFQTTDKSNISASTSQDDSVIQAFRAEMLTANTSMCAMDLWAAAGTDFGLHFFLNVPTYHVYSGVPAVANG